MKDSQKRGQCCRLTFGTSYEEWRGLLWGESPCLFTMKATRPRASAANTPKKTTIPMKRVEGILVSILFFWFLLVLASISFNFTAFFRSKIILNAFSSSFLICSLLLMSAHSFFSLFGKHFFSSFVVIRSKNGSARRGIIDL